VVLDVPGSLPAYAISTAMNIDVEADFLAEDLQNVRAADVQIETLSLGQ
jgi:hypothetical protein